MQTFHNPTKMLLGSTSIEQIGAEIKAGGIKKVLMVMGSGSIKANGVYDRVTKSLTANDIAWEELWGVQPNPLVSKVREGVAICKDSSKGIEGVLAVGGGSVIDSSKAICGGAKMDADIWCAFDRTAFPSDDLLPLYTVLTLSATASEFNAGSVISNPETKQKIPGSFRHPVATAVDPSVQFSLPWRQVVCGAVDAMSHLMETYFSPEANITTREVNLALQKSIIKSMQRIKANKEDLEARTNFCWAVSLALSGVNSFMLFGDWNVHYIEHAISAFNDKIYHAEGLAVISLAYYPVLYAKGTVNDQFELWAETIFGTKDVKEAFNKLKELYIFWGAPLTLQDLNIKPEDIPAIVAIEQGHQLTGTVSELFPLTAEDTKKILEISAGIAQ